MGPVCPYMDNFYETKRPWSWIDIFAAALFHGATIHEFGAYDLSYTPPLISPWDPV